MIDIKAASLALNAANKWVEDWYTLSLNPDFPDAMVYRNETYSAVMVALTAIFGNDTPGIRTDIHAAMTSSDITDWYAIIRQTLDVMVYLIAVSDYRYISVDEIDYRGWQNEENT